MSRSEKRTPIIKAKVQKMDKRLARRATRHYDIPSGCMYKKVYNLYACKYTLWTYLRRTSKPNLERLREFWAK